MENRVKKGFKSQHGYYPQLTIKAPGRINIMGEHTDYNDGYVLPAAIDYANYFAFSKSRGKTSKVHSIDLNESFEVDKDNVEKTNSKWINLILGVIDQMSDQIGQFDVTITGNIPQGAGLSSSAALCCGMAYGLSVLFDLNLEKWTLAKISQKSEHEFGGVVCGIMDQFASVFGVTNHVLELNCMTLEHKAHEFDISGYRFLL
ncbi:MAG: galactokinase family protein, partial [Bacteroidota bacterium]